MAEVNVNPVRMIFMVLVFFSVGNAVCGEVIPLKSGTDYTFKPPIKGIPQSILWKYKGNKVVEFENNQFKWYRLEGRAELNTKTGDLTLPKLKTGDSGLYESEILVEGEIQPSRHDIKVIDALPKPSVTCEANSTEAKLSCSVDSSAEYKWNAPGVEGEQGQTITVQKESHEPLYICIVTNEVSSNSTELHLKECFKEENSGVIKAIGIAIAIAVIVVIILILVFFIWRKYLKKNHDYCVVNPETGNNQAMEMENQKQQDPGEDDRATQDLIQNHSDLEQDEIENQTDQNEKTLLKESIGQHSEDMNGAEPPNGRQIPENSLASTQTETIDQVTDRGAEDPTQTVEGPPLKDKDDLTKCVSDPPGVTMDQGTDRGAEDPTQTVEGPPFNDKEDPSKCVSDPPGATMDQGTDRGAEDPTQTVEGPPLNDKEDPSKCVSDPPGATMDQGTDRGEDPPGYPEDGSDKGNDEGNPASTLADLKETKALEDSKKDSLSIHGDDQGQAASQPALISNNVTHEKISASAIEKKIEKPENLTGKPKEISSSGIVGKKIERYEEMAWKPREISSRSANKDSG